LIKLGNLDNCKSYERQDDELQHDPCGDGPYILYLSFEVGEVDSGRHAKYEKEEEYIAH